jgi:toxin ParE1/3/4
MAKITWSKPALNDLEDIYRFIARDSRSHAEEFVSRLIETAEGVAIFPDAGRAVAEFGGRRIRQALCGPYRILYAIGLDELEIVGVVHGARDLETWFSRRQPT